MIKIKIKYVRNPNQLPSKGNAFGPGISLVGRAYCISLFTSFVSLRSIDWATTDFARHFIFDDKREPLISRIRNLAHVILYRMSLNFVVLQKYPQLHICFKRYRTISRDYRFNAFNMCLIYVTFYGYLRQRNVYRQIYGSKY